MSYTIRKVRYYHTTVQDQPGEAYRILGTFADQGVNLLAFSAMPIGPASTQLTIFPEDSTALERLAKKSGMTLIGPYSAFIISGADEIGALARIHERLYRAKVNVYATNGVTVGDDAYGYIIYIRHEDLERASAALGV
ncbi:MAG: hypothetical protein R3330_09095 [Saprospiraceae bacterium]|nr:hypothetical protein [Saprospiraceae bacterium]